MLYFKSGCKDKGRNYYSPMFLKDILLRLYKQIIEPINQNYNSQRLEKDHAMVE